MKNRSTDDSHMKVAEFANNMINMVQNFLKSECLQRQRETLHHFQNVLTGKKRKFKTLIAVYIRLQQISYCSPWIHVLVKHCIHNKALQRTSSLSLQLSDGASK